MAYPVSYPVSKLVLWPLLKLFIKEIKGLENLPKTPFIIAANHASYVDGPLLIMLVAKHCNKRLRTFALKERFTGPFWNALFNWYGAIRVNGSLEKGLEALKKGDCLAVFPEGGRTYDGNIHKAKHSGLGVLAMLSSAPIIPIGLDTWHFWNRHMRIPNFKRAIKIRIGKPMFFKAKGKLTRQKAMAIVHKVMKEVAKLAGRKYG